MSWTESFGITEIVFTSVFVLAYAAFIWRTVDAARKLNAPFYKLAIKLVLRSLYFGLMLVALLGPSFGKIGKEVKATGKDIFFAVDLSGSMNATDVSPSRLKRVKYELKNIVDQFSTDRIGLIIFSSEAFVQCPMTYDRSALYLYIESLNTGLVPDAGTDFGPPLRIALDKMLTEDEPKAAEKSKIIILVSDGEDHGEATASVAGEVKEKGLVLFAMGVGTEKGSRLRSGRRGYILNEFGQPVVSKLDPKSLRELASSTGGKYYEISDKRDDTKKMIADIKKIKGNVRDTTKRDVADNKYYYFLALALFLMAVDALISIRTIKI
ncbi:BatB protein [Fulvitalea axinellae]|uniref:BatB protein n=1 Tax=Fulvitalea axinellae TaxID=1182444 RepID=A0AAU9CMB7_9BACT|nr:BatB protein [Fulvitalea axinellae]